ARHKALSALRRRTSDELDVDVIEFIEDPSDNPEVALQKTERSEVLRDCLKQLSPAHREIIDLVYYHARTPWSDSFCEQASRATGPRVARAPTWIAKVQLIGDHDWPSW